MRTFKSHSRWRKPTPEAKARAQERALARRADLGREYPAPRPDLAIRIVIENNETGRSHVMELRKPTKRARCDQYEILIDGVTMASRGGKTAARGMLIALMPPVLSDRNL